MDLGFNECTGHVFLELGFNIRQFNRKTGRIQPSRSNALFKVISVFLRFEITIGFLLDNNIVNQPDIVKVGRQGNQSCPDLFRFTGSKLSAFTASKY